MTAVRVSVAGCGSVSGPYLSDLSRSPYVQLVSLCDPVAERRDRRSEEYGVAETFGSVEEMLGGPHFDLLVNLTPMQEHCAVNKAALQAGRHVYCEKPIATAVDEGRELLAIARERGVGLWGAPNAVISPQFACISRALASGELGRVCAAHGRYGHTGPSWGPWFYRRGGGCLFDLGVYNITTLTGLLGPVKSVTALAGTAIPERVVDDETVQVEAEDNVAILMDHGDAVFSCVQTGFVYGAFSDRHTVEVIGTGGAANLLGYDWAPRGVEVRVAGSPDWQKRCLDSNGYSWETGASYIARCLAIGEAPLMTGEHALHVLEVMVGALQSAASGRRVDVSTTFPWPIVGP